MVGGDVMVFIGLVVPANEGVHAGLVERAGGVGVYLLIWVRWLVVVWVFLLIWVRELVVV